MKKLPVGNRFLPVGLMKLGITWQLKKRVLSAFKWIFSVWEKFAESKADCFFSKAGKPRVSPPFILCLCAHMKAEREVDRRTPKAHNQLLLVDFHPDSPVLGSTLNHICVSRSLFKYMY